MGEDWIFGGLCCCFFFGLLSLIFGISSLVQYNALKTAEVTECQYVYNTTVDCEYETTTRPKRTIHGTHTTYYYKVLPHYVLRSNDTYYNVECSADYNTTEYQVYYETDCLQVHEKDDFEKEYLGDQHNGEWHICYVANCDKNVWSLTHPDVFKEDYKYWFTSFGVLCG
eukprot:358838_1